MKKLLFVILLISVVFFSLIFFTNNQTDSFNFDYAYINENIWIKKDQEFQQVTLDGESENIEYRFLEITQDEKALLYVRFDYGVNTCKGIKYSIIDDSEKIVFEIDNIEAIFTSPLFGDKHAWDPQGRYFLYTGRDKFYKFEQTIKSTVLNWKVINPIEGIAGNLCQEIQISKDGNYFTMCNSTSTMNSIWGDLFIFNKKGELIKSFTDESGWDISYGGVNFVNNTKIVFQDQSKEKIFLYDIKEDFEEELLDKSAYDLNLTLDKKYLLVFEPKFQEDGFFISDFINLETSVVFTDLAEESRYISLWKIYEDLEIDNFSEVIFTNQFKSQHSQLVNSSLPNSYMPF